MPYTCHLCADAEPATVLITPLQGGDTMAIGPDCMVTGLCGLLSVAVQIDAEALYDAIIKLRADADASAAEQAQAGARCGALRSVAGEIESLCHRPEGHKGNHRDTSGHQWRATRTPAQVVPESETASA